VGLLLVAIVVALVARRLRLPYTVGLVLTGMLLAVSRVELGGHLTHDFIFDVVLPPLLFEAALNISWRELRRDLVPVLVLAIVGTVGAAATVTAGLVLALGWPIQPALLFGALIAATDPVAVIAMFKDNGVEGRLRLLVEAESLFNDGVAAVLFVLAFAWVETGAASTGLPFHDILWTLAVAVLGGTVCGLVCASATIVLAGRTTDHLVESTLTTVAAYGSFLLADRLHGSGVLATVAAGLVIGNFRPLKRNGQVWLSQRGREFILALWEFVAFLANSLVFLLIGSAVATLSFDQLQYREIAIILVLVLLSRAATVYPLSLVFSWSRWAIGIVDQHILWWGGLRGALALALALSLPSELPYHDTILIATFAVVAFSILVQGLTMPLMLAWGSRRQAREHPQGDAPTP
jgi:CPA1 family monovalent cation:H+ antiporter